MKKSVRDKRGFTLIELLVVIALMLSILGIAVVSLVGITNKKKESSKELIKEQIETAALEYFNANEFLFSNLKDDAFGVISVGKLVNDDYLNVVTNPVTGKRIGNCTIVVVKRKNNVFTSDVDDESFEKATDNQTGTQLTNVCDSILVSSDDIQGGKITYYDENYNKLSGKRYKDLSDNKKLWFNSKHLGENKNLIACSEDEVEVTNTKGVKIKVEKNSHGYCATIINGTNENITYSSKDRSWALTVAERVDTTPPKVSNLKVESENSYIENKNINQMNQYNDDVYYTLKLPSLISYRTNIKYIFDASIGRPGFFSGETNLEKIRNANLTLNGKSYKILYLMSDNSGYENDRFYIAIRNFFEKKDLANDGKFFIVQSDNIPKYNSTIEVLNELKRKNEYTLSYGSDYYMYFSSENKICETNLGNNKNLFGACWDIFPIYANSIKMNVKTLLSTILSSFSNSNPYTNKTYRKLSEFLYVPTFVTYDRTINGQITKVSFDYKDDTSKVYSYGLNKKYVKEKKRELKIGDILSQNDEEYTQALNQLKNQKDKEIIYNYSTKANTVVKNNELNKEYNKEILNSVKLTDKLEKSEDYYTKNKINKNSDSVILKHIYADGELDGSIDKYGLNIKDNAGNETTSEENYEKYKNCTYTWLKTWEGSFTEKYCEDDCNSYGTLVEKSSTRYLQAIDSVTDEICSEVGTYEGSTEQRTPNSLECPWTDCTTPSPTPTPNKPNQPNEPKEYTRKAFKFSEMDNFCSNKSAVSFSNCNSSDSSLNCRPNYPYKRYKFKELECSCTNDNGNITATSKDITETTHPDGYSYIFYTSEANCNKKANEGKNDVRQVCQHIVGDYLDFHGVYWNQGSANYWSGEGWYNNNYVHKKSVDEFTSEKKACEWACQE